MKNQKNGAAQAEQRQIAYISTTDSTRGVALLPPAVYISLAAAKSAAGFGDPNYSRRTSAPVPAEGAFFVPAVLCYGGRAWETFGSAGFLECRFANPRTAVPNFCLATVGDGSITQGAIMQNPTQSPSVRSRVRAHRAMAMAALHSDTSLKNRIARFRHHAEMARRLERAGGAK